MIDEAAIYADFVAELNRTPGETITLTKAELRAAVAAAAAGKALPASAKKGLSVDQKARIASLVQAQLSPKPVVAPPAADALDVEAAIADLLARVAKLEAKS